MVVRDVTRQEVDMNAKSGLTCLAIGLLGLSLVAALSIGLRAQRDGVTVQAHVAGMQLQGMAEADESSAAPDPDKAAFCRPGDSRCQPPKQELALAVSFDRQPQDSKALVAPLDVAPRKSQR
jgi:hypothetical protein